MVIIGARPMGFGGHAAQHFTNHAMGRPLACCVAIPGKEVHRGPLQTLAQQVKNPLLLLKPGRDLLQLVSAPGKEWALTQLIQDCPVRI